MQWWGREAIWLFYYTCAYSSLPSDHTYIYNCTHETKYKHKYIHTLRFTAVAHASGLYRQLGGSILLCGYKYKGEVSGICS